MTINLKKDFVIKSFTDFVLDSLIFRMVEVERKGSLHGWTNKYKGMAEIISSQSLQV